MDAKSRDIYHRVVARTKALGLRWPSGLARALNESAQRLNNWKTRGIPPSMHSRIAEALNWSVDELLGNDPPPNLGYWPFPGIPAKRFLTLTPGEQLAVQGKMLDEIIRIEAEHAAARSGATKRPPPRAA